MPFCEKAPSWTRQPVAASSVLGGAGEAVAVLPVLRQRDVRAVGDGLRLATVPEVVEDEAGAEHVLQPDVAEVARADERGAELRLDVEASVTRQSKVLPNMRIEFWGAFFKDCWRVGVSPGKFLNILTI